MVFSTLIQTTKKSIMKSVSLYLTGITSMAFVLLMYSCSKNKKETFAVQKDFTNTSQIQVFMAMVNTTRNYVFVDGNPITGALMSSGSIFPSTGYASSITGGIRSFLLLDTLPATTQIPLSFSENLQVGTNYTIFIYDTINAPKQKTVQTSIVIPSDTSSRIRFANFIYNPFAVPAVDVYSFNRQANIFTNIQVTDVTSFIPYPSELVTDTLYVRETATMNLLFKTTITGGLSRKRSYTYVYRGSHRGTKLATLFSNN